MYHDQIDRALFGDIQSGAGAGPDMPHPDAGLLFERILQGGHNTGVNRSNRAGQKNEAAAIRTDQSGDKQQKSQSNQHRKFFHDASPFSTGGV